MAYKTSNEYKKYIYSEDSEHSLDIIINGITINNDFVGEITLDDQVFNDSDFTLGSAIPCKIILSLHNEVVDEFDSVKEISFNYKLIIEEKEEIIPLGTYTVEKTECSSDDYTRYTLYDYMKKFDAEWDASKYMPCTRYELYSHMCEDFKIKKGSSSFINGNVIMDVYDSEYKARDYLIYISERAGGFAKVVRDELIIKSLGDVDEVNIFDGIIGEYSTDDKKKITKVVYANAIQRFEKGIDNGITIYLSQESPLSCTQEEVDNIFNSLNGLEYQSLDVEVWGDPAIDTGDVIRVGNFISFAQKYWTFGNGFYGNYRTKLKNITSGVNTNKVSEKTKRKRLEAKLNEVEGTIDLVSEQVDNIDKEIITNKQASGNPIEVTDAGEYPLESILIEGKSYQEIVPGEIKTVQGVTNLFNKDKYLDNYYYDGSGKKVTVPEKSYINQEYRPKEKVLYFSFSNRIGDALIRLCEYKTDGTFIRRTLVSVVGPIALNNEASYVIFSINQSSVNCFEDLQIIEGKTEKNYVLYGKWLEQKTIAKNCFCMKKQYFVNKSNVYQSFALDSFENNKLRVVCKYNGTYTEAFVDIPELDKGETYAISYKITENTTNFNPELKLANKGKVNASGYLRVNIELNNSSTNSVANTYVTFDEIQIVKEEFANDDYEEYKENSALIDMNIYDEEGNIIGYHELAKVDNERDTFLDGLLTKKIGKIILDGSENWLWYDRLVNGIQYTFAYIALPTLHAQTVEEKIYVISNRFIGTSTKDLMNQNDTISSWRTANSLCIHSDKFTSADEAKAYFKENPTEVYYVLATAEKYELEYEHLQLHKGYNYITLNDELYPNMEINYWTDSSLNAQYAKKSELTMTEESIRTDLSKKVSTDNFETVIEEVNNTFEQKISDSEASTKSEITRVTNNAITTAENYTNKQLANRPTKTEMTNAIEQKITDSENSIKMEVSEKIEDIQIGGTNLLLDSKRAISNSNYNIAIYTLAETPVKGKKYTFSLKGNLGTGKTYFMIFNSGGMVKLANLVYDEEQQVYKATFSWIDQSTDGSYTASNKSIYIYTYANTVTATSSIEWAKLEEGDKATSWVPADSEKLDTSKFTKAGIITEINEGVSNVKIYADNIQLEGTITANGTFKIDKSGYMSATGGTIAGFNITNDALFSDQTYGNYIYRNYIQRILADAGLDTMAYSIQKWTKDMKDYDILYSVDFGGNVDSAGYINADGIITAGNGLRNNKKTYDKDNIIAPEFFSGGSISSLSSVENNKWTELVALGPMAQGRYIVWGWFTYANNSKGYRSANISVGNNDNSTHEVVNAVSGQVTRIFLCRLITFGDSAHNLSFKVAQTSGGNLNCGVQYFGVRIQ